MRSGSDTRVGRAVSRVLQGFTYLAPRRAIEIDAELNRLLSDAEYGLIRRCSLPDRTHLLAVYQRLTALGCVDQDVLKAGLLHDAGKADAVVRVTLVHRTAAVLLKAVSPSWFRQLAGAGGRPWRRAFYLIEAHPSLGARLARTAGCNERVCWLIEHHHDALMGNDDGLRQLQWADEGRTG
jgi:hypothetical protein